MIFYSSSDKPTFRQIISKNIRYEKNRLDNIVRILHSTTTFEEYEALYLFWLGIDTDTATRKQRLQSLKSAEENVLKSLKRDANESILKQALSVIERDIYELNQLKSRFNINENYEIDLTHLNELKSAINQLSTAITRIEVRKSIIVEAKQEIEKEYANVDVEQLREVYLSAGKFIPEMQTRFEEMLSFHNTMLKEKIKFIGGEIPKLNLELDRLTGILRENINKEKEIAIKLKKSGVISELEGIVYKLNLKFEQKGKFEEQLRQLNDATERLQAMETELTNINEGIAFYDKDLEEKIVQFNFFFSKVSQKLYDEQFILSHQKNSRAYELKVTSIDGNLGTGKKKGQIAAFDIAYIQFCDSNSIPCLHFILYDQVESIHDNQLTILAEVASQNNIQLVIPVLRDKLPPDLKPELYQVLILSQESKLFKI